MKPTLNNSTLAITSEGKIVATWPCSGSVGGQPSTPVRSNRGKKLPPSTITKDEIARLLQACNRGPTGQRNKALIILLYRTGLRVSEALALSTWDVDFTGSTLTVLHGKGDKARQISIDQGTVAALHNWLAFRPYITRSLDGPHLFCTTGGKSISTSYTRALLPRLARIAGIEKRIHAHALRHTAAYDLLSEGARIDVIQKMLGHSTIANTVRYLGHVTTPEVHAFITARQWSL